MTESTLPAPQGWRVLGFGKHPEIAAAIQAQLRSAALRARNFALTDDDDGDAQLTQELAEEQYDGIAIGSFINGQDPEDRPDAATTEWFNRALNIIHLAAHPRPRSSSSAAQRTRSPRSSASSAHPDPPLAPTRQPARTPTSSPTGSLRSDCPSPHETTTAAAGTTASGVKQPRSAWRATTSPRPRFGAGTAHSSASETSDLDCADKRDRRRRRCAKQAPRGPLRRPIRALQ